MEVFNVMAVERKPLITSASPVFLKVPSHKRGAVGNRSWRIKYWPSVLVPLVLVFAIILSDNVQILCVCVHAVLAGLCLYFSSLSCV